MAGADVAAAAAGGSGSCPGGVLRPRDGRPRRILRRRGAQHGAVAHGPGVTAEPPIWVGDFLSTIQINARLRSGTSAGQGLKTNYYKPLMISNVCT